MSIESAIHNVGEYYSAQYLADSKGFAKDIRDKNAHWKEQGSQSVPRRLQSLAEEYFRAKARALDYPDPALRMQASEASIDHWHPALLHALGYTPEPFDLELPSEKKQLPVLLRLHRHGQPWLVIAQAPFTVTSGDWIEEPLEEDVLPSAETIEDLPTLIDTWEQAIAVLLKQEDAPRWLMLLAGSRVYLFDAHSYAQGRYLYIDLDDAFSSKDVATFNAISALLARESLAPAAESEDVLHEKLREGSLKSTHGVSEQLQGAVREAIELIANGWIESRRAQNRGFRQLSDAENPLPDGSRKVTAEQLKHDALVYVYRILFCLYAEARGGELGILPITDDAYRLGYSLEALRDLADKGQPGTNSENGSYFSDHLATLFALVHRGFHPEQQDSTTSDGIQERAAAYNANQSEMFRLPQGQLFDDDSSKSKASKRILTGTSKTFVIQPLTATLFDPKATPLLERIKLSNRILQQVIRRLSLGTGSNNRQIGRINYAELGIVQLGSVYEGLLSYKGFFADEDLIQVVKAPKKNKGEQPVVNDNAIDPKEPTWFVPITRQDDFKTGEIIVEHRNPSKSRIYKTGTFILHLNGVDRVNSASYYTPEVLTRALVNEALKERLKDFGPEQADEILTLKICEPAMGSAAFLVEGLDQLGRKYLELKQEQVGEAIDPSAFEDELRRVRHYIAVHNVYGVDLNPTAVELGSLSLWLASIHSLKVQGGENGSPDLYQPGQTPWFGLRLRAGNSLIGARRAVWSQDQLLTGKHFGKDAEAPRQLKPGEERGEDEIYHFLVWDEDMAPAARDKLMKSYWKEECDAINDWQRKQVKQRWKPEEIAKARVICKQIDVLWQDYAKHRIAGLEQTECTATVWPIHSGSDDALASGPGLEFQESVKANLESQSGPFQRLKLLMDSWCSFYFWPLQESENLPSRDAWLAAADVLLGCDSVNDSATRAMLDMRLGDEIKLEELFAESQQQLPDANEIVESVPWYRIAIEVDEAQNFHHWELVFTEILGPLFEKRKVDPDGFDLIFGNPPWVGISWNEAKSLSEMDPQLGVLGSDATDCVAARDEVLMQGTNSLVYQKEFTEIAGTAQYLNDRTLFPVLAGLRTNLYKNFIERSWAFLSIKGLAGLLHPESIFVDAAGGNFRREYYGRLKAHYQFQNALSLFKDVKENRKFGINIYSGIRKAVSFRHISNLYHTKTLVQSLSPNVSSSRIPRIRDESGSRILEGHTARVVQIGPSELDLIHDIFGSKGTHTETTILPQLHSNLSLRILTKLASGRQKIADLEPAQLYSTQFLNETNGPKYGFMKKNISRTYVVESESELVLTLGNIGIANIYAKRAVNSSSTQAKYETVEVQDSLDGQLPSTIFFPASGIHEKIPTIKNFSPPKKYTNFYRLLIRRRSQPDDTRTLISAIAPPDVMHGFSIFGMAFSNYNQLTLIAGLTFSIVFDFFAKSLAKEDWLFDSIGKLPILSGKTSFLIINRCLRLSCISSSFSNLWETVASEGIVGDCWSVNSEVLDRGQHKWSDLNHLKWDRGMVLVSDLSRRQALLEIDVLTALGFGLDLKELITIYDLYFTSFNTKDKGELYDSNGYAVPKYGTDLSTGKLIKELQEYEYDSRPITVTWKIDNGNQTVTKTFNPPFTHFDRIEDYKTAYRVFSERLGIDNKEIADAG
jgi:hypothetical protein